MLSLTDKETLSGLKKNNLIFPWHRSVLPLETNFQGWKKEKKKKQIHACFVVVGECHLWGHWEADLVRAVIALFLHKGRHDGTASNKNAERKKQFQEM